MLLGWKRAVVLTLLLAMALWVSACGNEEAKPDDIRETDGEAKEDVVSSSDPVSLTLYGIGSLTTEWFEENVIRFVREHLPHIEIKHVGGISPADFVTSGETADLLNLATQSMSQVKDVGLLADLTPLIEQHQFDLSVLEDGLIDTIKAYSGNNQILLMPFGTGNYGLYYNIDLFDRFGVSYPVDGMTWDEVHDLAVRMTRVEDGVQYYGFAPNYQFMIQFNQLSLPYVDPQTHRAVVHTDGWRRIFETIGGFYSIERSLFDGTDRGRLFREERRLAMTAGPSQFHLLKPLAEQGNPLHFDVVTFPVYPDAPGTSLQLASNAFGIGVNSRHKDAAMEVLKLMMSEEVQTYGAEIVRLTALKSEVVRQATGSSDPYLADKNLQSLYANKMAVTKVVTDYDTIAKNGLVAAFREYAQGSIDVNTALRTAEESINQAIQREKSQ